MARLATTLQEALRDKEIGAKIDKTGVTLENRGPEEAAKFLARYHKKHAEIAKSAKIEAQ